MNLLSRIKNLINLGKLIAGSNNLYQITTLKGETIDDVPFMQNFGMKTEPPKNSKLLAAFRGGRKDSGVILVVENDSGAVALSEGETVIFNNHGSTIHLKADGSIQIQGGDVSVEDGDVLINTGGLSALDDIDSGGDVTAQGDVSDSNLTTPTMISMRTLFNAHVHPVSGSVTLIPTTQM